MNAGSVTRVTAAGVVSVLVARGRDYADVTSLKGVYSGGAGGSEITVTMDLTRVA